MQLSYGSLACIALFSVTLALMATGTESKIYDCCTKVSTQNITVPIIGYSIQKRNPPCVQAVIFQTESGHICSHWKQDWVFQRIRELESSRRARKVQAATTTSSP